MFYAHAGKATDNAFTTENGHPTRTFFAYPTKAAREEARNKIWEESNGEKNLIDCSRSLVAKYAGKGFYVAPAGEVYRDYEEYDLDMDYQSMKSRTGKYAV